MKKNIRKPTYWTDFEDLCKKLFGETFRVLKDKEICLYGEYRTRRLVLDAWERMGEKN